MSENTENRDIIDVAQEAVDPYDVPDQTGSSSGIYIVRDSHGDTCALDLRDQLGLLPKHPDRKTGRYTFADPDSFTSYLDKHMSHGTSELFADDRACTIRAVINAHQAGEEGLAGFGDHTATLNMRQSEDWIAWGQGGDGKLIAQTDFAEFIEDHLPNFATPTGADMLELAQTFQATTKGEFASSQRVKSGETSLSYTNEHSASAGKRGQIAIPDTFTLGLQVFEGGARYKVEARFRYRIHDGRLALGYRLTRPRDIQRAAFAEVVHEVRNGLDDHPIWSV